MAACSRHQELLDREALLKGVAYQAETMWVFGGCQKDSDIHAAIYSSLHWYGTPTWCKKKEIPTAFSLWQQSATPSDQHHFDKHDDYEQNSWKVAEKLREY